MSPETTKQRTGQAIAELDAEVRTARGSRACRRLRRRGMLPANLYGHKQENVLLAVTEREFAHEFAAGHRIMHLNWGGSRQTGMVKEVQYDTLGDRIVHVDFTRVSLKERVHFRVPVETIGVAKGATGGGVFEHVRKELDVEGPAAEIPEKFELHVSDMAVGDMIRIRDVELPPNCKFLHAQPEDVIVAIHAHRRAAAEAAPEEAVPGEEAEAAEGSEAAQGEAKDE
jgi:large subunit ribosomal protein L25